MMTIVRIIIIIFALIAGMQFFLWAVFEITKEDRLDGMNPFELKREYEMLVEAHRQREKKRSMKP